MTKKLILSLGIVVSIVTGVLIFFFAIEYEKLINAIIIISTVSLLILWLQIDSIEFGINISKILKILFVVFNLVAIIWYAIITRKKRAPVFLLKYYGYLFSLLVLSIIVIFILTLLIPSAPINSVL